MGRTVFEIEQWPATHIDEWRQFYTMRPFGAWRDNWHMAILADIVARVNGNDIPMSHYFYMDAQTAAELRKKEDLEKFMRIKMVVGNG